MMYEVIYEVAVTIRLIFEKYLEEWIFALFHAALLADYVRNYLDIRRDYVGLREWSPEASEGIAKKSSAVGILDSFVLDVQGLGNKGFLVPMTDFSDRLDSFVEGRISQLHDRANGFVLIGLAGTLWVLAKFALSLPANTADQVLPALVDAMGRAFPIGLIGLLATVATQFFAANPEEKLRQGLASSTTAAISYRREHTQTSSEGIIQATEQLDSASKRLTEAIGPLQDLQATLGDVLNPVVEVFGQRLDASLNLIRAHFESLRISTADLEKTLERTRESSQALFGIVGQTRESLDEIPQSVTSIREAVEKQTDDLTRLSNAIDSVEESLKTSATQAAQSVEEFRNMPEVALASLRELSEKVFETWHRTGERMEQEWNDSARGFRQELRNSHNNLMAQLEGSYREFGSKIDQSALEVAKIGRNINEIIRIAVKHAEERIEGDLMRIDQALRERYPEVVGDIDAFSTRLEQMVEDIEGAGGRLAGQLRALEDYQQSLLQTQRKIDDLLDRLALPDAPNRAWQIEVAAALRSMDSHLQQMRLRQERPYWLRRSLATLYDWFRGIRR